MRKLHIILLAILLLATGCHKGRKRFRNLDANINPQPVEIVRLDLELMNIDPRKTSVQLKEITNKYPEEMLLWENMLGYDSTNIAYLAPDWAIFLSDTLYRNTNAEIQKQYADVSDIEAELGKAYARLHIFYPQIPVPKVFFFISGFNSSILVDENIIGVGVDRYLGKDYWVYQNLYNVYNYQLYGMRRECVAADVLSTTLFSHFRYPDIQSRLLDKMLYFGRMLYMLSVIFPDMPENEIIEYTPTQWRWCLDNERAAWGQILDNKALFSTDSFEHNQYLFDAPFTGPISQDSPGRMATWFGYRIVNSYMENNPDITMQELMAESDSQKILEMSGYNP